MQRVRLAEGPGSGALVQGSEQVPSLQERRASWYRNVHLTVISGQFGQQVGLKRGPEQPAGHTCRLVSRGQTVVLVLKSAALRGEPALGALLGAHGGRWLWWWQVSQRLTRAPHGILGELITGEVGAQPLVRYRRAVPAALETLHPFPHQM